MIRTGQLASVFVLVLTAVSLAGEPAWIIVDSKEGEFSVQMPRKPDVNRTKNEKGVDGVVKVFEIECKANGSIYLIHKFILSTAIVKGTEDAELDRERDDVAKIFNGKVTEERSIKAGDKVGRDFTVRGKPDKADGIVTVRVREYLIGNAVFVIAVGSAPNRELPDDTGRFLGSLETGKDRKRAQGSPEVAEKGKPLAPWGTAFDPENVGVFDSTMKSLTVKVTASPKVSLSPQPALRTPRVMRDVEGDFVFTVKVNGEFKPGGKSVNPKVVPYNGAGILVYSDADNYIRLERAAANRGGKINPFVNFTEFEGGHSRRQH